MALIYSLMYREHKVVADLPEDETDFSMPCTERHQALAFETADVDHALAFQAEMQRRNPEHKDGYWVRVDNIVPVPKEAT